MPSTLTPPVPPVPEAALNLRLTWDVCCRCGKHLGILGFDYRDVLDDEGRRMEIDVSALYPRPEPAATRARIAARRCSSGVHAVDGDL